MIYEAVNRTVLDCIPDTVKCVLDIGCGSGTFGRMIKQRTQCEVIGLTYSDQEAALAASSLDKVFICNLNQFDGDWTKLKNIDCVVCSHVLEHLYKPQEFLKSLHQVLAQDALLIIALPNTLHWKQRLEFLKGNFKYTDGGVMDRTHFRFFDWDTSLELLENSGYTVVTRIADGYFPLPGVRKLFKPISSWLDQSSTKTMPGLFAVQFILVAQSSLV